MSGFFDGGADFAGFENLIPQVHYQGNEGGFGIGEYGDGYTGQGDRIYWGNLEGGDAAAGDAGVCAAFAGGAGGAAVSAFRGVSGGGR